MTNNNPDILLTPEKIALGFNSEEKFVTITFFASSAGTALSFVLEQKDIIMLEKELARVKKLAGMG